MASARECPPLTAARYLHAAEQKADRALPTKERSPCDLSCHVEKKRNGRVTMKSEKLNLNKDFRRLYGRGRSQVHPLLVTYIILNKSGRIRYGITTGKKVGGAVERNRARRVIQAAMRENLKLVDCSGADIVFVARSRTVLAKSQDVEMAMNKHFKQGGLIPSDEQ